MTQQLTTKPKETPRQREALLIYFGLGAERSLEKVREELGKKGFKISRISIEKWSSKHKWVDRVQEMDDKAGELLEEKAIKQATVKKSQILGFIRNTFVKYNQALLDNSVVPNAGDVKKMWEIMRTELGMVLPGAQAQGESLYIGKVEINQKILNIVKRAESEAKEVLREEIENE